MSDLLRVPAGPVDLAAYDPAATPGAGRRAKAEADWPTSRPLVRAAGAAVRGGRRRRPAGAGCCLVLQGMDTSGKDGTTKHVAGQVNPQGLRITSFKAPTAAERRHDFLWRIRRRRARTRVHRRLQPLAVRGRARRARARARPASPSGARRYDRINALRAPSCADDGVHIVKVFLHISKEEQQERLLARLDDPTKHWKYNPARRRRARVLGRLPGRLRRRAGAVQHRRGALVRGARRTASGTATGRSARLLLEALEEMAPAYPPADFDLAAERERVERS